MEEDKITKNIRLNREKCARYYNKNKDDPEFKRKFAERAKAYYEQNKEQMRKYNLDRYYAKKALLANLPAQVEA